MIGLATMILTLTEAVRLEVIDRFHVMPEKVVAVPLAAASGFRPVTKPAAQPYFVFVGTLEPRKNIPMLLDAWREVRRKHNVDLILAGRRRADFPAIVQEEGLRVLGEVPEAALPPLYTNAVAAVYASEYEGFGLPVLEAMQCGAPVIVSKDPAVTEVAGGAALAVTDAAEMVTAMQSLLRDPALRAEKSARSLARTRDFSWAKTARLTHDVYREAVARFG